MSVGRGAASDIRVDGAAVSRLHAELIWEGPELVVRDLASGNGTFVNGRRIQRALLCEGHLLRLGDAVGVIARVARNQLDDGGLALGGVVFGPDAYERLAELQRSAHGVGPLVVVGEAGTGKKSAARALHLLSGRRGAFEVVNCASLSMRRAQAALFGNQRGGTLVLDHLANLALPVQALLLRALEEKPVAPLGEAGLAPVDLRIVVASRVPLRELVARQHVRPDLAALLSGQTITVPPLRGQPSEIGCLFRHFCTRFSPQRPPRVDSRLIERVLLHDWPGNVRQLASFTRRLIARHADGVTSPLALEAQLRPSEIRDLTLPA